METKAIQPLMPFLGPPAPSAPVDRAESAFGDMLQTLIKETGTRQRESDQAMMDLHTGGETSLHDAMLAVEKADISLRYMVQVRNKAIEAYQEIMRLQL